MSRIGKMPISIPSGVEIKITDKSFFCKGPKGELNLNLNPNIKVEKKDSQIEVSLPKNSDKKSLWGTYRQLVANMILGVTTGYEKKLEVVGVGYRAQLKGNKLVLIIGFTHPVEIEAPNGINFKVEKNTIIISGIDKQLVGQVAAEVRSKKIPEPYKGKGIRYVGEYVRRKEGKKVVAASS